MKQRSARNSLNCHQIPHSGFQGVLCFRVKISARSCFSSLLSPVLPASGEGPCRPRRGNSQSWRSTGVARPRERAESLRLSPLQPAQAVTPRVRHPRTLPDALMKIAIDAMGGDHAPDEIVRGAVEETPKSPTRRSSSSDNPTASRSPWPPPGPVPRTSRSSPPPKSSRCTRTRAAPSSASATRRSTSAWAW